MGMYDTILCRRPLPDGLVAEDFQSKSLHNTLSVYEIGADGRLRELAIGGNGEPLRVAAGASHFPACYLRSSSGLSFTAATGLSASR